MVCGGRLITAGSEHREMRPRPLFLLLLIQVQYCTQRESTIEQYALRLLPSADIYRGTP